MVVQAGIEAMLIPCRSSSTPFGLCNVDMVNFCVGSFTSRCANDLIKVFAVLYNLNAPNFTQIFKGFRLENSEETGVWRVRISSKRQLLSYQELSLLCGHFGSVVFCSETVHVVNTLLKAELINELETTISVDDFATLIKKI